LHIGNARTALYNWLLARGQGGSLVLRIEDTDRERSTPENVEQILDALRWLELGWDEGPLSQAERRPRHEEAIERLLDSGHAYTDEGGDAFGRVRAEGLLVSQVGRGTFVTRGGSVAERYRGPERASDLDSTRIRARGVQALKSFLAFAEGGPLDASPATGTDQERVKPSAFERSIRDLLDHSGIATRSPVTTSSTPRRSGSTSTTATRPRWPSTSPRASTAPSSSTRRTAARTPTSS
jgi:hypothetical protein